MPSKKAKERMANTYRGRRSPLPPDHIGHMDLKVGVIRDVIPNPKASHKYFIVTINFGAIFSDVVAALLDPQYTMKDLFGRMVVVLCNIKPGFSRGLFCNGVLMCAKKDDKVELLNPPLKTRPGDKIYVEGYSRPTHPGKEQIYCPGDWRNETRAFTDMNYVRLFEDNIAPDLKVDSERRVLYRGIPLSVEGKEGFITTEFLSDCPATYVDIEEPLYPGQK